MQARTERENKNFSLKLAREIKLNWGTTHVYFFIFAVTICYVSFLLLRVCAYAACNMFRWMFGWHEHWDALAREIAQIGGRNLEEGANLSARIPRRFSILRRAQCECTPN